MTWVLRPIIVAATFAVCASAWAPQARAANDVKAGILTCHVSSGWGLVFGSSRELNCVYSPDQAASSEEDYAGHIRKFGVDIGYQAGGVIAWAVLAPSNTVQKGALA